MTSGEKQRHDQQIATFKHALEQSAAKRVEMGRELAKVSEERDVALAAHSRVADELMETRRQLDCGGKCTSCLKCLKLMYAGACLGEEAAREKNTRLYEALTDMVDFAREHWQEGPPTCRYCGEPLSDHGAAWRTTDAGQTLEPCPARAAAELVKPWQERCAGSDNSANCQPGEAAPK